MDSNRSYLYNIDPINNDSEYIESLSGYLIRLASIHNISTGNLINKVINPYIEKRYISNIASKGGDGFYKSSYCINGKGELAKDFFNVLEFLSGNTNLQDLTLWKFKSILSNRGLLREKKAWCPVCLVEMREENKVYEPLLWKFSLYEICIKHKIILEDQCWKCNNKLDELTRESNLGYCSKCKKWLGHKSIETNDIEEYQEKISQLVSDLLKWGMQFDVIPYKKEDISDCLNTLVAKYFFSNINKAANYFGVSKSTFYGWYSGKNIPTLKGVFNICIKLNISLDQFFQIDKEPKLSVESVELVKKDKVIKRNYDHEKIKEYLDDIILNNVTISISAISRQIGCDRRLLSLAFPSEIQKVKSIYLLSMESKKRKREGEIISRIESAFFEFLSRNEYPSYKKMEALIGPNVFREKIFKDKLNKLKSQFFLL